MNLPCSNMDKETGNLSFEDNKHSTGQCEHQTTHISVNETRLTHDPTIEGNEVSKGKIFYYGAISMVSVALITAAVLIIISMISFLSGDFCVDHEEANESAAVEEFFHVGLIGLHLFGLVGAVAGLVLLIMWSPPLTTNTEYLGEDNIIQAMSECASICFLFEGLLLCLIGAKVGTNMNEHLPTWVWFMPYFLSGASMFAIILILHIRYLVAPITCRRRKQKRMITATALIFAIHLFATVPFGMVCAWLYKERYC